MIIKLVSTEQQAIEAVNTNPNADMETANIRPCENGKYWLYDSYVGLCVADREKNGYNDSDFFMTVWDEASKSFKEIMYATTRGWTYPMMNSKVDAPQALIDDFKRVRKAVDKKMAPTLAKLRKAYKRQNGSRSICPF